MIYHGASDLIDLPRTVSLAARRLRAARVKHPFDSIVVTGMSGVIVGVPVALKLNIPVVIVRKETDTACHDSGWLINFQQLGARSLFLDDFVSSGKTVTRVTRLVRKYGRDGGSVVTGSYLYRGDAFTWEPCAPPPDDVLPVVASPSRETPLSLVPSASCPCTH